jgi:hypothetical protein
MSDPPCILVLSVIPYQKGVSHGTRTRISKRTDRLRIIA